MDEKYLKMLEEYVEMWKEKIEAYGERAWAGIILNEEKRAWETFGIFGWPYFDEKDYGKVRFFLARSLINAVEPEIKAMREESDREGE
jgi:hypothetical protein